MKKLLIVFGFLVGIVSFLGLGLYIGAYKVFPYYLIKSIKDEVKYTFVPPTERYDYRTVDVSKQISINPSNADSMREAIRIVILGDRNPMGVASVTVTKKSDYEYNSLENLEELEQFEVIQDYGINSVGYIFHPKQSNRRLFIYQEGHDGDFRNGKETIAWFLKKGFTVYAFSMPLLGKNNQPLVVDARFRTIQLGGNHDMLQYLKNPLSFFVQPVLAMLQYAERQGFENISASGLSGGAWSITLAAALDDRIDNSFSVAGVYPMYILMNSSDMNGDFEEGYPPLVLSIGYMDLFVLGSIGPGRKQMQMYNEFDPCCFSGRKAEHFGPTVKQVVQQFKQGSFDIFIDSVNRKHSISEVMMERMYDEIMNSPIRSSDEDLAFAENGECM